MNIDNKLPLFKNFMTESRLNNGGVKTSIDQSAVSSGEESNVDLNLQNESKNGQSNLNKKKKKLDSMFKLKKNELCENEKSLDENQVDKKINLKLLNLL